MSDDIVERLRENVEEVPDAYWHSKYIKDDVREAADQIERLRARLTMRNEYIDRLEAERERLRKIEKAAINLREAWPEEVTGICPADEYQLALVALIHVLNPGGDDD